MARLKESPRPASSKVTRQTLELHSPGLFIQAKQLDKPGAVVVESEDYMEPRDEPRDEDAASDDSTEGVEGVLKDPDGAVSFGLPKLVERITHPMFRDAAYVFLGNSVHMFAVAYMRAMATATVYGGTILYGALPQPPERLAELRKGDKELLEACIQAGRSKGFDFEGTFLIAKVFTTNPWSALDIDMLGADLDTMDLLTTEADLLFEALVSRILGYQR
ncbi:hypothetical protein WJX72_009192 [[Myrmecia] bisecta]|uniref:Uncharacterized protein n=1 Tax=[Myrmecia] bisecta TaxID=41462 RepID=A0AAW1QS96_9CHLO